MKPLRLVLLTLILCAVGSSHAQGQIYRAGYVAGTVSLIVEVLDDDLAHFELAPAGELPPVDQPIAVSPMIFKTDYDGASAIEFPSENELTTPDMRLHIDAETLCVTVSDRTRTPELVLSTICPTLDDGIKGLTFSQEGTTDVYGLGEQFRRRGGADGNWIDNRRLPGNQYGNHMVSFNGGNVGNAQFPIMYALGENTENYAVFVDDVYQQAWDFTANPFALHTQNAPLRWYVMTGRDLSDLRADTMELTGTPPVPPRQMLGLWVSEYGYDNWDELFGVLDSLRAEDFPLDGFVLDLQWFGGIEADASQMGSLAWDEENFPNPAAVITQLRAEYGLGVMAIEEPYVSTTARGYADALDAGVLVRQCADCDPVSFDEWWGSGGMVDFTNPEAAAWWHDNRRQHLIDDGVIGHWTDLGEPENFNENAVYYGGDHAAVANLYNLLWSQSVWDGYQRHAVDLRPFILSRSGTSGSQRYGVAMWSGDIGANMTSLAEQMNVQMHMSLSGMDYFGSDVGGFMRQSFDPVLGMEGMYTVWLANSVLTDVPLRPHAFNVSNIYQTAPSLIGHVASNRANVRLRYELNPYLYSLMHQAYRTGEAVFPPLVYAFQDDTAVRGIGGQKMIGSHLMMAALSDTDPQLTSVYLPRGGWFNYRTDAFFDSVGETIDVYPSVGGSIEAPLFVRDGAVIPIMHVDDQTLNTLGQRVDGSSDDTVIFSVYHAAQNGSFTLFEDDGATMAYQSGAVRETLVTHEAIDGAIVVTVNAASGTFNGASDERAVEIRLFSPNHTITQVMVNGEILPEMTSPDESHGWRIDESGAIIARLGRVSVSDTAIFTFEG